MNPPSIDLQSIGHVAGELQTPVSVIQQIVAELNIVPVQRLNRVPYYTDQDVRLIADRLISLRSAGPLSDRSHNLH